MKTFYCGLTKQIIGILIMSASEFISMKNMSKSIKGSEKILERANQ